jgi:two-component system, NtrC family, response regulator AtoC
MAKKPPLILVVDDEPNVGMIFHRVLGEEGYEVISATNGMECLRVLGKENPRMVFLDLRMPGMDGLETLRRLRETHDSLPVIIMTAFQTVDSAVECMKLGAQDYLIKPLDNQHVKSIVKQTLELGEISQKGASKPQAPEPEGLPAEDIVAESPSMKQTLSLVGRVAPTDLTVLILGESGTGKEVIARLIHRQSPRKKNPFVVVDCASLPETLIESELFGFEKGAFTGADASKPGKFEMANKGTLFLDEIGNLPPGIQAKLLRFLQERSIERLGTRKGPIVLDVRVLAATNADLEKAVKEGSFREDLFHRLKEFLVELPPLRRRGPEEIRRFVDHTLERFAVQTGKKELRLAPETFQTIERYPWPGNIRELQNALRSAALLADDEILPSHLPLSVQTSQKFPPATPASSQGLDDVVKRIEREHILTTLKRVKGDSTSAAEELHISEDELKKKIQTHGIHPDEFRNG